MFDKLITRIEKQAVLIHHLKLSRKFRIETTNKARAERDQVVANYNEKTSELIKIINAQDIEINKKNKRIDFLLCNNQEMNNLYNAMMESESDACTKISRIKEIFKDPFLMKESKYDRVKDVANDKR